MVGPVFLERNPPIHLLLAVGPFILHNYLCCPALAPLHTSLSTIFPSSLMLRGSVPICLIILHSTYGWLKKWEFHLLTWRLITHGPRSSSGGISCNTSSWGLGHFHRTYVHEHTHFFLRNNRHYRSLEKRRPSSVPTTQIFSLRQNTSKLSKTVLQG